MWFIQWTRHIFARLLAWNQGLSAFNQIHTIVYWHSNDYDDVTVFSKTFVPVGPREICFSNRGPLGILHWEISVKGVRNNVDIRYVRRWVVFISARLPGRSTSYTVYCGHSVKVNWLLCTGAMSLGIGGIVLSENSLYISGHQVPMSTVWAS